MPPGSSFTGTTAKRDPISWADHGLHEFLCRDLTDVLKLTPLFPHAYMGETLWLAWQAR